MKLELDRPLVVLDLETTGVRIGVDRVVQVAALKIHADGSETRWSTLVNPQMPIPARATEVHGITDEKVAAAPSMAAVAPVLARGLVGCDVAGYNVRRFDWLFLMADFERVGFVFDWQPRLIDSLAIFYRFHPRDLSAALKTYCGREHDKAHDAVGDVEATRDVLLAQLDAHALPTTVAELEKTFVDPDEIDLSGKFKFEGDRAVITFGKYAGTPLRDVDPSFLQWMLKQDFPRDAKHIAREALAGRLPERAS